METNDPQKSQFSLKVTGTVEKFASIEPNQVRFTGPEGKELKVQINITPEAKYPFKITGNRVKDGKYIRYKLEERKKPEPVGYTLSVESLKTDVGRFRDNIYLTTDSKVRPEIDIPVYGNIYSKNQNPEDNPGQINPIQGNPAESPAVQNPPGQAPPVQNPPVQKKP